MTQTTLKHPRRDVSVFHGVVTVAPEMFRFFEVVERVARTDSTVLVRGETGTGKELVARAIQRLSRRRNGPFAAINCATLTPELSASELFGHVRGAFTGAIRDRRGLFARADGGTVYLDEIAELPLNLQGRLLRVLQERTFIPVGGTDPIRVDVRLLAATNKALRDEIERGRFREDLMYRVRVIPIFLPRLADRTGDIEALAWHFIDDRNAQGLRHVEAITADAMEAMLAYEWPGNVRELRNNIEFAFAIGEGPVLTIDDLTPELRGEPPPFRDRDPRSLTAADVERQQLLDALRQARGRKGKAAELLGMSRSTLWRKLKVHGISP